MKFSNYHNINELSNCRAYAHQGHVLRFEKLIKGFRSYRPLAFFCLKEIGSEIVSGKRINPLKIRIEVAVAAIKFSNPERGFTNELVLWPLRAYYGPTGGLRLSGLMLFSKLLKV